MEKKQFKKYTPEQMAEALSATKLGMPVNTASKRFNVPRITLRNKLKGISPEVCNMGPPTVLSEEEEGRIITWIVDIARAGFPVTKQSLIDTVAKLIKELNRKTPFSDGIPGKKWFKSFLKRHPNISLKTSEKLTGYRSKLTEIDIRNWFEEVSNYFEENDYNEILENGNRIFNADETGISLCPKTGKVLAPKGVKNIYDVSKTSEKESLTVLLTVSASGKIAPPMVVYPYKRIPSEIVNSFPKGWGLGKSDSGWMTGEVFFEYMANIFEPWLTETNVERPVIFFVDGHKSHLTLHLSMFLREKQIILVAFYPNATHVLQPLDVSVFYPLKSKWKFYVRKWLTEHENRQVMRQNVAPLLENILNDFSPETIVNGFRVCGLFPFDSNNVDYSKIIQKSNGNKKEEYEKTSNQTHHTVQEIKKCLSVLESNIPLSILKAMKKHPEEEWKGPESSKDLYDIWKKMIKLTRMSVSNETKNMIETVNQNNKESIEILQEDENLEIHVEEPQPNELDKNHKHTPDSAIPSTSKTNVPEVNNMYYHPNNQTNGQQIEETLAEGHVQSKESPFKKYLFWPKDEVKSQKKVQERSRSVITSDYWLNEQRKKQNFKLEKEQLKENRKRAREEKQQEKLKNNQTKKLKKAETKGKKTAPKKVEQNKKLDWKCCKCRLAWKDQHFFERKAKWLSCISCPNKVHKICVPIKYMVSLGLSTCDSEDEIEFVCEDCGITVDSSDENENWDNETDED